jgi:hypothetical protein
MEKIKGLFNSFEHIDWVKMWVVMGAVLAIWAGLSSIIPIEIYKYVSTILSAIMAGIAFAMRGGKYVKDRSIPLPKDPNAV